MAQQVAVTLADFHLGNLARKATVTLFQNKTNMTKHTLLVTLAEEQRLTLKP
jgi:hypothetical protein